MQSASASICARAADRPAQALRHAANACTGVGCLQVVVCLRGLVCGEQSGELVAADGVSCFEPDEVRSREAGCGQQRAPGPTAG
jgi:hypothetical protein